MMTIAQYKEFPNLKNLNLIGSMMRHTTSKTILQIIDKIKIKIG